MAYAEWDDVVGRYRELAKVGGDTEVGSYHIAAAENDLNTMFAGHFTLPFSSNNTTIKFMTVDLTYIKYFENNDPARAETKRNALSGLIEMIKSGKAGMIADDGTVMYSDLIGGTTVYSNTKDYHPTFGIGPIEHMSIDSSQLYDEEAARD